MEPKTTLNLLKYFFSNNIQKTIQFLLSSFEKKAWLDTSNSSRLLPVVTNPSMIFAKAVFKINTTKTIQLEEIKSAPPEMKYYYALHIANV
ncbi:hypothetical protein [Flavobacterium gilvum]|uniref:Uncharacterized protein n=1 Tax=Flavobacterium gilvum TaxID=1492737 RepID=A0AAC9N480_9FLAO|nr:hypothetical protein [Flavobacterium gilvum]AOW10255.1 hypothetical protein EM308_12480 [Flavobacterium gilvum]KFC57716.1 hypothetical protein FEM08_35070 [Flavobacterium gilvum]